MRKTKLLTNEQIDQFEKNIYCELFSAAHTNLEGVHQSWNQVSRGAKKNPDVVCAYVKQLIHIGHATNEVEDLIRTTLKSKWQPELVMIYGSLPFHDLNRQLVIVGAWLKLHGQQPELLFVLGKLCVRVQLWGKAKDYFERCLLLGPNAAASLEYGRLMEHLGENEAAMEIYKAGLKV